MTQTAIAHMTEVSDVPGSMPRSSHDHHADSLPAVARPPARSGSAPGGTARQTPPRSVKAPALHDPFRRPSSDPTLSVRPPTTPAWAPTPTLTDRSALDAPALVIGETLVDTQHGDGRSSHPAGCGANVAVGLARLGRPVELATSIGADAHGASARTHLERENVRIAAGSDRASRTSTAGARPGEHAETTAVDLVWEPPAARPARYPQVVHVSSVGAVLQPGAATVARTVAAYRPGATITYDLGVHPELMGPPEDVRTQVEALVARADVVKVSTQDLDWLYPEEDPKVVARRWLTSGVGIVVVAAGAGGAWAGSAIGAEATATGRELDPAAGGVGDEFMAALIDALWNGGLLGVAAREDLHTLGKGSLQALVDYATTAAALTASRPAQEPPTRADLDAARGVPRVAARA